jgi:hypothetical protein
VSYIGSDYTQQLTTPAIDYFSGNGVATTFTLTRSVTSVFSVKVVVNGVEQNPRTAYTINQAGNLVFDGAPSAGSNNIYVTYNSQVGQFVTPSPGTVNTPQLGSVSNINSLANNLTLQTNGSTALTVDQNQIIKIQNTATFNTSLQLGRVHIALTDAVRNTTLMNANNTNTLMVLSVPFANPEASPSNAGARWGMLFNGNGDFNTTQASLPTATKSAGMFAVSEDPGAGYNRQVGLALHTCGFDQGHREAMRINGNGHMLRPRHPAFMIFGTGGATSYGDAAEFIIGTGVHYDSTNSYNTATGRYTAPVAGFYTFSYGAYTYVGGQMSFKRNGVTWAPSDSIGLCTAGATEIRGTTLYISLAAGDNVSFGWRSGYSGQIYHSHSWFSGHLVG